MCRSKMDVNAAEPNSLPRRNSPTTTPQPPTTSSSNSRPGDFNPSPSITTTSRYYSSGSSYRLNSSTATDSFESNRTSLASFRQSLSENPNIYDFAEVRSATNNFLAKRYSSSSSPSWRCSLRGRDVVVFQRKFRRSIETSELRDKLSVMCRGHHKSIVKLLGASISVNHIYMVYEFMQGGDLASCLRNPRNPDFTVLSTWMSRMQVAADLVDGLNYIHNNTGQCINLIHKYVKSSSIIVTEPSFNAKICNFGTAELCGETAIEHIDVKSEKRIDTGEIEISEDAPSPLNRSESRLQQFEGSRGYMSPEFQSTGLATQKSDVYSFGIVMLELLSGEEPVKYKFDKKNGNFTKISVIEAARNAVDGSTGEEVDRRLRRWVDRRLKDSFPVYVVEKVTRIALECVDVDPDKRPNMSRVSNKISKLYLETEKWSEKVKVPTEFSVSFAPR